MVAVFVDHHPGAVELQPGLDQQAASAARCRRRTSPGARTEALQACRRRSLKRGSEDVVDGRHCARPPGGCLQSQRCRSRCVRARCRCGGLMPGAGAVAPGADGGVAGCGARCRARRRRARLCAECRARWRCCSELKVWDALPADARTPVYDMHVEGDAAGAALDFSAWYAGRRGAGLDRRRRRTRACAGRGAVLRAACQRAVATATVTAPLLVLAEGKASATRERAGRGDAGATPTASARVAARLVSDRAARRPGAAVVPLARRAGAAAVRPAAAGHGLALVWSRARRARRSELLAMDDGRLRAELMADATPARPATCAWPARARAWPLALARAEPCLRPGLGAAGRRRARGAPAGRPGPEPGPGRRGARWPSVLAEREPWRAAGRRAAAAPLRPRAHGAHAAPWARLTDGLLHLFASRTPLVRELRNRGLSLVNRLHPLKRLLAARALDS